jgi:hypothetical protein
MLQYQRVAQKRVIDFSSLGQISTLKARYIRANAWHQATETVTTSMVVCNTCRQKIVQGLELDYFADPFYVATVWQRHGYRLQGSSARYVQGLSPGRKELFGIIKQ